jgi:hypothetical protein
MIQAVNQMTSPHREAFIPLTSPSKLNYHTSSSKATSTYQTLGKAPVLGTARHITEKPVVYAADPLAGQLLANNYLHLADRNAAMIEKTFIPLSNENP